MEEQSMSVMMKRTGLTIVLVCGVGGFGPRVEAQSAPAGSQTDMRIVSSLVDTSGARREKLRGRVAAAMHVDPYLFDRHIEVGFAKNAIVLRGFVLSAWDLQEAVRVAQKAAGAAQVVDELSIKGDER
jgi:hypothetical protein